MPNQAPVITLPTITSLQQGTAVAIPGIISDPDGAPGELYGVEMTGFGRWTVASTSGLSVFGGGSILMGTLANLNAALATASFTPYSFLTGPSSLAVIATDKVLGFDPATTFIKSADSITAPAIKGFTAVPAGTLGTAPHDIVGGALLVAENSAAGTLVGTVTGLDADGGTLAYALTNDAGGRFAIDGAGRITVSNGTPVDFEQNAFHSVTVRVTDAGGLIFEKTFTVTVGNADPEVATGGAANDILFGGSSNDTISGGGGNDYLVGGSGADLLFGDGGTDQLDGGTGNDYLAGGTGNDVLLGGLDDDLVDGGADNDYLAGGTGNDILMGGGGVDQVEGGDGNDYLDGGAGNDVLVGGDGIDQLEGGFGNDYLDGGTGNDVLVGGDGQDYLTGGGGNDYLVGGQGADYLTGGAGGDAFSFAGPSEGQDTIADFSRAEGDHILLSASGFGLSSLADGVNFFAGTAPAPTSAATTLLYDTATGLLSLDADGAGAGAAVGIAALAGSPALQASDILLV